MKTQILKSNLLLLLAASIWGFAFVAQRVGMQYVGAFTFNGVRFALGSLSLLPLILYFNRQESKRENSTGSFKKAVVPGLLAGMVLFLAASLQQVGMLETTAGKAAFITGLYIVLVPILGIFLKQKMSINNWLGALIAIAGLYLLCVTDSFTIAKGDLLELAGSFFWAVHILLIGHFAGKVDALKLSAIQFATCSVLSLAAALIMEKIALPDLLQAAVPILYGGICSVGIAYTLQVVGQKNAHPAHAAIILSMETVFAALGGFLLLDEYLSFRGLVGCTLMFIGMLLPQFQVFKRRNSKQKLHPL